MKKTLAIAGLLACTFGSPAAAQNMPLHSFVERGTKLEKKGPLALLQRGEIRALQTEMQGASARLREERLAAAAAGRKPAFCPPAKSQSMGAQQLLAELRTIAATQPRTATVKDGMRILLAKRFPCPA